MCKEVNVQNNCENTLSPTFVLAFLNHIQVLKAANTSLERRLGLWLQKGEVEAPALQNLS